MGDSEGGDPNNNENELMQIVFLGKLFMQIESKPRNQSELVVSAASHI